MFSNRYIFIYSAILVIVVATALTITAVQLKPVQNENIRIEKMQNILRAVNIEADVKNAGTLYEKYINESFAVNINGDIVEGVNAFNVDLKQELKKLPEIRNLPVYICQMDTAKRYYIVPVRGKGLWGPIWGYIGLDSDCNTIVGAYFDHQGETPGLGAEIDTKEFQDNFTGKRIFDEAGEFTSIKVIKGGASPDNFHGVDAISGGTITCDGVTDMLKDGLSQYLNYFKKQQKQ